MVGPLGGTLTPCSGRLPVTFKSPLTGIFGDSNCGGHWASELKMAGYDHIVITGKARRPVYLWVDNDRVQIRDARSIGGKSTWETDDLTREDMGGKKRPSGLHRTSRRKSGRFAAIICNRARAAARCGPGAVMGSKNLKAIGVRGGSRHPRCRQVGAFRRGRGGSERLASCNGGERQTGTAPQAAMFLPACSRR